MYNLSYCVIALKNHRKTPKSAVHFIQSPINREIIISWTETFLKSAVTFKWKWKGYIVNWVTRYQCYEMVFGDNQVCLPSSSCVHGLKLSFGRRPPEVCGWWADRKAGWLGCTVSAATMGTTSYSSPFDTLITGPAEADTTSFLSSLGLLSFYSLIKSRERIDL